MSDETGHDEHSHYEISLTAGQAFAAFVLLLLSLAAAFAFGLMIGRQQGDERLVVRKEPPVVTEAAIPKKSGKIVELGVADDGFKARATKTDTATTASPVLMEGATTNGSAATTTAASTAGEPSKAASAPELSPAKTTSAAVSTAPKPATPQPRPGENARPAATAKPVSPEPSHAAKSSPVYAQLLSTGDQRTAEALAAKLIDRGFTSAYVDRSSNEKGPVFRVRVSFATETEARAAEPKLKEFAKDVWIVK